MLIAAHGWPANLLTQILENLESLWADWLDARRSPQYTRASLEALEERLLAHIDAVVLAADAALPSLRISLGADWEAAVLAGAQAMLLREDPAWDREVWDAFVAARDPATRPGIGLALRYGPPAALAETLDAAAAGADPALALPAAELLARRGRLLPRSLAPGDWVDHPDPQVRAAAWGVLAQMAPAAGTVSAQDRFASGLADRDPNAAAAAWLAAVQSRQPWLLDHCRSRAAADPAALRWLAVLATPADHEVVLAAARAAAHGPERFAALGSLGVRAAIEALLEALDDPDPATAVAAAAAFSRITGQDIASNTRVKLLAAAVEPVDELAAEFADEDFLPDPERARRWWADAHAGFAADRRYNRGVLLAGDLETADMLARWEAAVRAAYHAAAAPAPASFDRFPAAAMSRAP